MSRGKLVTATPEYLNFRASVDRVVADLSDVDSTYQERYVTITGYAVDDDPGFQGIAKLFSGSELDLVEQSIASLQERNETLRELNAQLQDNLATAEQAVSLATNLKFV